MFCVDSASRVLWSIMQFHDIYYYLANHKPPCKALYLSKLETCHMGQNRELIESVYLVLLYLYIHYLQGAKLRLVILVSH